METLKKFEYSLKKIKIMVLRVGKEEVEGIDERVQHDTVLGMDSYKYLEIIINIEGNLKDHIHEMEQK